jgi:hypothetical protein
MDDVVVKLYERLESAVKRLRNGNHDDHDFLPALLWALLEYNRSHRDELQQLRDKTEKITSIVDSLAETLQEECEKLRNNTTNELLKTADEAKASIGSLAQTVREECESVRHQLGKVAETIGTLLNSSNEDLKQTLRQSAIQLAKRSSRLGSSLYF